MVINNAISKEIFGIKLNQNAQDLVSIKFINNYKANDIETLYGYWWLPLEDRNISPFFKEISIIIDNHFNINSVQGLSFFKNIEMCKSFLKTYTSNMEKKKNIKLTPFTENYGSFKEYAFSFRGNGYFRSIGCIDNFKKKKVYMYHQLRTIKYQKAVENFYDKD